MPTKPVEFTKTISLKLTPGLYRLVSIMRQVYGDDADVFAAAGGAGQAVARAIAVATGLAG